MSTFTLVNDPLNQLLIKLGSELSTMYDNSQRLKIKSSWKQETKDIAKNNMNDVRILTFKMNSNKSFELILYKDFTGNLFIEIQTLLKHVTSWGHGKLHGYTANLKNVRSFIDDIPAEFNGCHKITILGLSNRISEGYFVPVSSLWFYVAKEYYHRLIKFINKDFVNGDYEGWIYINLFKKSTIIKRVKLGRTANIDQRNEKYESEAKKHGETCDNWAIIKVKEVVFAENYLKKFYDNYPDVKKIKKGKTEYLNISSDSDESSQQLLSTANYWNEYITSDPIKDIVIGRLEDSIIKYTVASDELAEVIEGNDDIEDEYEYEEDENNEEVVVIEDDCEEDVESNQ